MKKYDWVKIGAYCKWNDVAIDDYPIEDREIARETIYEVAHIHSDVLDEIDDDTIILISNDTSDVEVYAHELIKI
jgi:hypothetical protein